MAVLQTEGIFLALRSDTEVYLKVGFEVILKVGLLHLHRYSLCMHKWSTVITGEDTSTSDNCVHLVSNLKLDVDT